jgi:predicted MFS family arabinose efflux permease
MPVIFRNLRIQLGLIALVSFSGYYGLYSIGSIQEALKFSLDLSDNQIAIVQGPALLVPSLVLAIPIGLMVDRFNRARLLRIFCGLTLLSMILTAQSFSMPMLVFARALAGVGNLGIAFAGCSLACSLVSPERRGRAILLVGVAQVVGSASAFGLGGWLEGAFSAPEGWRKILLLMLAPATLSLLASFFLSDVPVKRDEEGVKKPVSDVPGFRQWRLVAILTVGTVMAEIGRSSAFVWGVPILSRNFHMSPGSVGSLIGTLILASGMVGPILGGTLSDLSFRRYGAAGVLRFLAVLSVLVIPAGLFGVVNNYAAALILFFLINVLAVAKGVSATAAVAVIMPDAVRGLSWGLTNMISGIFVSLAPLIVSVSAGHFGGDIGVGLAITTSIAALGATVLLFFGSRTAQSNP